MGKGRIPFSYYTLPTTSQLEKSTQKMSAETKIDSMGDAARAAMNFKFVADNPQKMMRQGRRSTLEKFADSVKDVKEEAAPLLRHEQRDEITVQHYPCLTLVLVVLCVPLGVYAKMKS